jgi:PKD repeat protein/type II secretory pathway pseudopilin PulG
MTIGLTSAVVVAIAIILFAANVTIINAQQLTNQPSVTQNGTRLFESTEDSFRLQVPEGWVIHDVNNTGSILSEESTQGYGILAQLCPQEQQQQQRAAIPNAGSNSSDTFSSCNQSENDIIHIVRYLDLDNRLQAANNVTTNSNNNTIMTNDNILSYHLQKLQEVGYRGIQIVNSADITVNLTNPQTNQTIATVPAKFVEMTYSTAIASNEIREGYFILTATNVTSPNLGMTKGYSIFYEGTFYEGTSTAAGTATAATIQKTTTATPSGSLPRPAAALRQAFESFELIAAPEVAEDMLAAQSEQAQEVEEEPTNPLTVDITSSDTEGGEEAAAPATFEFEADIAGGIEPYTISWNFGDDSEESNEQTVSHTFEEAGTYNVGLTVTDSGSQTASDSIVINVEEALSPLPTIEPPAEEEQPITTEQPLTVEITSSDTEGGGIAPATFEFEADVTGGTEPYTYSWDFDGEGSEESNEQTVSHTFEEAGTYNVGLTVTDSGSQTASDSIVINVEEAPAEEEQQAPAADEVVEEEDNDPGSDDLIDVDGFIDDLFDRFGLDN